MVDLQQDVEKVDGAAPVAAASAAAPATSQPENSQDSTPQVADKSAAKNASQPPQHMSKGEKLYNKAVYNWLGYWTNLGISLVIADFFCNGKGKKPLLWAAGKCAQGLQKLGAPLNGAHKVSRVVLETLSLLSGGFLLVIPTKLLEDRKRELVYKANERLGVDQHAPDGHKMTADEIYLKEDQPPTSWGNVIWRRLLGAGAVQVTAQALEHGFKNKNVPRSDTHPLNPYVEGSPLIETTGVLGGRERATDLIVGGVNKGSEFLTGKRFTGIAARYLNLAALDTFFTVITASVMKFTNGAKPLPEGCKELPCPPKTQEEPQQQQPVPAAPTPAAPTAAAPEPTVLASRSEMEERGAVPMVIPNTAPRRGGMESFKKSEIAPRSIHPSAVNDALEGGLAMAP
jgi:hypothetical protein